MKHSLPITLILVVTFLCAQLVGLMITYQYLEDSSLYLVEPPAVKNQSLSFIPIIMSILIGTGLLLLIIRLGLRKVWTVWFGLSIFIALSMALFPFYSSAIRGIFGSHTSLSLLAFVMLAAGLALLKIYWRNIYYQNVAELFIYGGIISLFFPIINIFSATVLLILIAFYDMYAVWKSGHMVKLATFQTESKLFAGLMIPYPTMRGEKSAGKVHAQVQVKAKTHQQSVRKDASATASTTTVAILGGGDIAFPLLFSTALLKDAGIEFALTSTLGATLGLVLLLMYSKPGRFYPAMPFIAGGCLVAVGVVGFFVWL